MKRMLLAAAFAALATVLPEAASSATGAASVYKATVGPGFTITLAKKPVRAGKITLVVSDRSSIHDFHLTGPGVNVKTSIGGTGTKTFGITLKTGTYRYVCDPHASIMHGAFTIR